VPSSAKNAATKAAEATGGAAAATAEKAGDVGEAATGAASKAGEVIGDVTEATTDAVTGAAGEVTEQAGGFMKWLKGLFGGGEK